MLYGIPPVRMVQLAKLAAINFPHIVKETFAGISKPNDVYTAFSLSDKD
jgi:hypothetical protein